MTIDVIVGDITLCDDDAIVNAANEMLTPGGGVCGAIHLAAGKELAAVCAKIGYCNTGSAVMTPGFHLKSRTVIHAVGPRWIDGKHQEPNLLEQCYRSIFKLIEQHHLNSVAIPAISTGIYGYPLHPATQIAVNVAKEQDRSLKNICITFVCYNEEVAKIYRETIES